MAADDLPLTGELITTPKRHPGGRPTSYKPEYCDLLLEYFETRSIDREPDRLVRSESNTNTQYQLVPKPLPTILGFCISMGIGRSTFNQWVNRHPEFAEARARAGEIGEEVLAQDAYRGLVPPIIATWLGSNYTAGLRDRKEVVTEITVSQPTSLDKLPDAQLQQIQAWLAETERKQIEAAGSADT